MVTESGSGVCVAQLAPASQTARFRISLSTFSLMIMAATGRQTTIIGSGKAAHRHEEIVEPRSRTEG